MIRVSIFRDDTDMITGYRVKGHAGYDDSGQDIVCAAVSILVINTINSIENLTSDGTRIECKDDEKKGIIEFHVTGELSSETIILLKSLEFGLHAISDEFGKEYLKLDDGLQKKRCAKKRKNDEQNA